MNTLHIVMIGAGEYKSFGPEPSTYFARFARGDGAVLDLPLTEEQLGMVLGFAAPGEPPAEEPTTVAQQVAPGRPVMPAEDEDTPPPPLQLRRPQVATSPQLFATSDDEDRSL